jgi:hypothetical protein
MALIDKKIPKQQASGQKDRAQSLRMVFSFFYPDYTVDPGIAPGRAPCGARGLYHRSGIGKFSSLTLPRRSYLLIGVYLQNISLSSAVG